MAHGGSNPTAPENRCGRPGSDETGPHSRVSVSPGAEIAPSAPRPLVRVFSVIPVTPSRPQGTFLSFLPPHLPACSHLSRETQGLTLDGLPPPLLSARPARPSGSFPLRRGGSGGGAGQPGWRPWPLELPRLLVLSLGLSFPLATVLPRPILPIRLAEPRPSCPSSLALPFPTFSPSCLSPQLSVTSFSLSHSFPVIPPGHIGQP